MVLFSDNNNKIISVDDNFDPNTGENLAINDFITKVKQKNGNVTPINIFQDQKGQQVAVPYGQEKKFTDLGLKPKEQIQAEQLAQEAHNKVLSGDIGYTPNKTESFWTALGQGASGNTIPQVTGVVGGVQNVLKGNSYGSGFNEGKEVGQSLVANREKGNPITSELGKSIGTAATQLATGGATSIPGMVAAGAGLGATGELENQINKEQPLSVGNIAKEGEIGGAEGLAGGVIGKGIQKVGEIASKAGKGFIPQAVKDSFLQGLSSKDLTNPEINSNNFKAGATYARTYNDAVKDINSQIGATKGDLLQNVGEVDHQPIINLIDDEQSKLYNAYQKTALSHEKESIDNAYNLLQESKDTLKLNPNDPVAIDLMKQKLGDIQFDDVKPIKKSREAIKSINDVRNGMMNYLQDKSEKLGGTNLGYKTILDAEDASNLHSIQFTPNEIISLGSNNPSASAVAKLDNAQQLNNKIQSNPALDSALKNRLNTLTNDILEVGKQASLAKTVKKGGFPNLANQAGYMLSQTPDVVKTGAKLIYGIPENIYNNLPIEIQKLISLYPDYAKRFQSKDNQQQ